MGAITFQAARGLSLLGDEVGAWMADTTAETLVGSELVTNGGFATDTDWTKGTGWSIAAGVASHAAGSAGDLTQTMSVTVGETYIITFDTPTITVSSFLYIIGTDPQYESIGSAFSSGGSYQHTFIAQSTTIGIRAGSPFDGSIDNVSVRLAVPDLSTADNGLGVYGSITKAAVATGADLVGYSGFGLDASLAPDLTGYADQAAAVADGWSLGAGWTFDAANDEFDKAAGTASATTYLIPVTVGASYAITYTIANYSAGSARINLTGVGGTYHAADGTYTQTLVAENATTYLELYAGAAFVGSIKAISVKKINALEQPYNADLDFGTGDFCYMGWIKQPDTTSIEIIFRRRDPADTGSFFGPYVDSSGQFVHQNNSSSINSGVAIDDSEWHFVAVSRVSGVAYVYIDGVLATSGADTTNQTVTTATLLIGLSHSSTFALAGDLSLWRADGTGRTAAQIKSIYDKEKHLFKPYSYYTQEGESYSFDLEQMTPRPSVVENKNETRTLSSKRRSIVHSISKEWEINTGVIHRTDGTERLRKSEFDELMFSTNGSEQFTYDPYGTIASPVDPLTVQRVSQGYTLPPIDNTELFRSSFRVAEVDE